MDAKQVLEVFVARGMIDRSLSEDVKSAMEASGKEVGEVLKDYSIIQSPDDIWPVIAQELGMELIDLNNVNPPEELLALIPSGMARLHGALPVNVSAEGLTVALVDPLNPQTAEDLRFALEKNIIVAVAPDYLIEKKINELYGGQEQAMDELLGQMDLAGGRSDSDIEAEANSAPIIRYVDLVIFQAINAKASDIHFEPFEGDFKIRYRVDGALYEM